MAPHVVLLGTADTKLRELLYLRKRITGQGATVSFIDVGRQPIDHEAITITQAELVDKYGGEEKPSDLMKLPRGDVIKFMARCATAALKDYYDEGIMGDDEIHGIVSAGGSGGTTLAAAVMREALPIGFPKLIVSTVASGDVSPFVGESDITMMPSIVDVAGSNGLLKNIMSNAAGAIVGMAREYEKLLESDSDASSRKSSGKKRVGITMFGVTTPAVDAIRERLENAFDVEVTVFHATGHGGKAMERLIRSGDLNAVIDLTTTEVCDFLAGGVMSAGPSRLEAALEAGIPNIISLGATDMVNFGPKATVPERYQARKLSEHNSTVTLMRTSPAECEAIGKFIVEKIKKHMKSPEMVKVMIPKGGVSIMATPGAPFADAAADEAIFRAVKTGLSDTKVEVIEDYRAINDSGFAMLVAEKFSVVAGLKRS